jgi:hypothetical protein
MKYVCVLPSDDGRKFLAVREGTSWALPHVICGPTWIADAAGDIQREFRDRYGVDVAVLRCLRWTDSSIACEVEALSFERRRPERCWLNAGESERLLPPEDAAAVIAWSGNRGWERRIAPWQQRGWFAEARQWIAERVGVVKALTQVKAGWNGSYVLRVETSSRTLYFKASRPHTPGEPTVIRVLSPRWSPHLPSIAGADEERCWLLMHDIAGRETNSQDPAELADAAQLMARMQIDQADDADAWLNSGCPDRSLDVMHASLDRLLITIPSRLCDAGVLDAAERAEIASFVPRAESMCKKLSAFSVPLRSLHHEDFRDGNAMRTAEGTVVLIDWSDTVVAHPLFTLQRFLWFMRPPDGVPRHEIGDTDADACRRAIRDAYLGEFDQFERRPRLLEAFRIASQLSPIYDLLRFASAPETNDVLDRGLSPEEHRIARHLMEHILEICRAPR